MLWTTANVSSVDPNAGAYLKDSSDLCLELVSASHGIGTDSAVWTSPGNMYVHAAGVEVTPGEDSDQEGGICK